MPVVDELPNQCTTVNGLEHAVTDLAATHAQNVLVHLTLAYLKPLADVVEAPYWLVVTVNKHLVEAGNHDVIDQITRLLHLTEHKNLIFLMPNEVKL